MVILYDMLRCFRGKSFLDNLQYFEFIFIYSESTILCIVVYISSGFHSGYRVHYQRGNMKINLNFKFTVFSMYALLLMLVVLAACDRSSGSGNIIGRVLLDNGQAVESRVTAGIGSGRLSVYSDRHND